MQRNILDEFLEDVLSYIKFPFVKNEIRDELRNHILEKIDTYIDKGYKLEEAEGLAIKDMGDPKEIGIGLNKQHNPLLGWLVKITNNLAVLLGILGLIYMLPLLILTLASRNPIHDIAKENIEYRIDLDEQVKIDNRIINFTNIVYEKNGNMNIIYNYRETGLFPGGWSFSPVELVLDDLGNEYFSRSGSESGGFRTRGRTTIKNFNEEAQELIINFDRFNRKYRIEIPLEIGDNYD